MWVYFLLIMDTSANRIGTDLAGLEGGMEVAQITGLFDRTVEHIKLKKAEAPSGIYAKFSTE